MKPSRAIPRRSPPTEDLGIPNAVCLRFVGPFRHAPSGHEYEDGRFLIPETSEFLVNGVGPAHWVRPTAARWAEFWRVCRALDVWSWPEWLGDRDDSGLGWHLVLEAQGRRLVSAGRVAGAPQGQHRKLMSLHAELQRLLGQDELLVESGLTCKGVQPENPLNCWPKNFAGPVVPEFVLLGDSGELGWKPDTIRITDGVVERPRLPGGVRRLSGEQWARFWAALHKSQLWRVAQGRSPRTPLAQLSAQGEFCELRFVVEAQGQMLAFQGCGRTKAERAALRSRLAYLRAVLGQLVLEAPAGAPPQLDPGGDRQPPPLRPWEQPDHTKPASDWPWDLEGPVVPDRIRIRLHGAVGVMPIENPEFTDGIAGRWRYRPWPIRRLPAQWAEFWQLFRRCELHHLPNRHPCIEDWDPCYAVHDFGWRRPDVLWDLAIDWGRYQLRQHVTGLDPAFWGDRFQELRHALINLADPDGFPLFRPCPFTVRQLLK